MHKVKEVTKNKFSGPVYNLSVQFDESYLAEGKAVHNCSFSAAIKGSFYAEEMRKCRDDNRICKVPYDPNIKVHTAWDVGWSDDTVITFYQVLGKEIKFKETIYILISYFL